MALSRASRLSSGSSPLATCAVPASHTPVKTEPEARRGEQGADKHRLTLPCFPAGLGWAGLGWGGPSGTHRQATPCAASQGMAWPAEAQFVCLFPLPSPMQSLCFLLNASKCKALFWCGRRCTKFRAALLERAITQKATKVQTAGPHPRFRIADGVAYEGWWEEIPREFRCPK